MNAKRHLGQPGQFDQRIRELAQTRLPSNTAKMMAPLFPLGMPGGYITIAFATARWLHRRRRGGGPDIVASAWLGFAAQYAIKRVVPRERPRRPGIRRRVESFPSGHTTGTTALAVTMAHVLRRERVISTPTALLIGVGAPLLMGVYRVIDDEHWATDVLAGWVLGAAIGLTCSKRLAEPAAAPAVRLGNWHGVRQPRAAVSVGKQ